MSRPAGRTPSRMVVDRGCHHVTMSPWTTDGVETLYQVYIYTYTRYVYEYEYIICLLPKWVALLVWFAGSRATLPKNANRNNTARFADVHLIARKGPAICLLVVYGSLQSLVVQTT